MDDTFILTPFFLDDPLPDLERLSKADWIINRPRLTANKTQQNLIELYKPLRDRVTETLQKGNRPVSIAGDCCTSLGFLAGLQMADISPTLIWFDAHGDFNTWETSPSGFLGGMPLAMMVGRGEQTIPAGIGLKTLSESLVILTDARDLDREERRALESSDVRHMANPVSLLDMPFPPGPLYLHFDTDIINPGEAPAMNYLAEGGPSVAVLSQIFRRLAQTAQLVAVSVSTWNPALDKDGRTSQAVLGLINDLLGNQPYRGD